MIICYINKQAAYPAANSDIKVTLLNPFIKDGDEKTMEVVFPMSIPENRNVFGSINRLDTHFRMDEYEDCRLVVNGMEIIHGTGTITSVSEKEVKLQIFCGKSYLRFKASFDNIYIDDIYYGEVLPRHQHLSGKPQTSISVFNLASDINDHGYIGEPGFYAFLPIHDETNDLQVNMPTYLFKETSDHLTDKSKPVGVNITFPGIQLNLMYVMKKVMERLGYDLVYNAYNVTPWNRLFVASAKMTLVMSRTLPHWTAYKFLDEFRKLFNATYVFDEDSKTVKIIPFGESGSAGTEEVDPLEEFSTSFDEEGLEYLGSSNLEYELSDCERNYDVIPQDVRKAFEVREYDTINELYSAWNTMTQKEKLTTIFHCPVGFFYGITNLDDDGNVVSCLLRECGWFSPLVRAEGGSTVDLKIVPVAMMEQKCIIGARDVYNWERVTGGGWKMLGGQQYQIDSIVANIACDYYANENVVFWSDTDKESNELEYVTVQDVIEEGVSVPDKTDDDAVMEVFFASGTVLTSTSKEKYGWDSGNDYTFTPQQPVAFTDYRQAAYVAGVPMWSLGLNPVERVNSVGLFHNRGIRIRQNMNGNNEICIKFLYDGKPDPRKIYVIRNRKFVCSKIEVGVNENGIERLKTGYFYEML